MSSPDPARQLKIVGPHGSVDLFLGGVLPIERLAELRFQIGASGWVRHPHIEFVRRPVRPSIPLPGADLSWQQVLIGSPCGELPVAHRFVAGERTEARLGRIDDPDVVTTMRYSAVLRLMAGEWTTLEAFERDGHIEGDWSAILLLAGICDTVEFTDAMRASAAAVGPALAALADG